MTIPRPEYPRPQFVRADWLCLNGEWQFEIDPGDSGLERGLRDRALSGQHHRAVLPGVAPVRRRPHRLHGGGLVSARGDDPGGVARAARAAALRGGGLRRHGLGQRQSRSAAIAAASRRSPAICDGLTGGETVTIVVRARDDNRAGAAARQAVHQVRARTRCFYTRTTGIWQTVWMEPVPEIALRRPRLTPDVANGMIRLEQPLTGNRPGLRLHAALRDERGVVAEAECAADLDLSPRLDLPIPEGRRRLWSPEDPHLYDVEIELRDAHGAGRGPRRQLRGPAQHRPGRPAVQDQRRDRLPAAGARPGLLPRRRHDRADRRGAAP